jgi:hypothetical protein
MQKTLRVEKQGLARKDSERVLGFFWFCVRVGTLDDNLTVCVIAGLPGGRGIRDLRAG